jgi:hypothetical protein
LALKPGFAVDRVTVKGFDTSRMHSMNKRVIGAALAARGSSPAKVGEYSRVQ